MFSVWERKAFRQGCQVAAGIDEAGRGPLAGPVTAAIAAIKGSAQIDASVVKLFQKLLFLENGFRDSKHLSAKQREEIFEAIKDIPQIKWRVSSVGSSVIDKINIGQATKLAWWRCLKKLDICPGFLFLDGRASLSRLALPQEAVVKGDQKLFLLSLASILAKVSRDRLMERLDKKYPGYGFSSHKGYGTYSHLKKLQEIGPCPAHRQSFQPVFNCLSFQEKIYYIVKKIPRGQAMTYHQVARIAGSPRAFRAVGQALGKNYCPNIPCHRVVCSNGSLGGYNRGEGQKRSLTIG